MKIVSFKDRFAIADDDGKIVDDSNGHGFKTKRSAHRAAWYKFKGGKEKIEQKECKKAEFFRSHPGLEKFVSDYSIMYCKELCRGEITEEDFLADIKEKFGIDMQPEYLYD